MSTGITHQNHPYASPQSEVRSHYVAQLVEDGAQRNSGMGIASFVCAICAGFMTFALVVVAGYLEAATPGGLDENSPAAIVVGLMLIGLVGLHLLGMGLGLAGVCQARRKKVFAVLGLMFNLLVVGGIVGLMLIGLAVKA